MLGSFLHFFLLIVNINIHKLAPPGLIYSVRTKLGQSEVDICVWLFHPRGHKDPVVPTIWQKAQIFQKWPPELFDYCHW